jgi:hypothetical protein
MGWVQWENRAGKVLAGSESRSHLSHQEDVVQPSPIVLVVIEQYLGSSSGTSQEMKESSARTSSGPGC